MGRVRGLAGAVALLLGAVAATASVDTEVPIALKAQGTLVGETADVWRFPATAGTALTFTVKAGKGADLDLAAALFDPEGSTAPLDGLVDQGKKLTLKNLPLHSTGLYRLEVSAAGSGDYSLAVKGKAQKSFADTLSLDGEGTVPFFFTAPPGSSVSLKATAAKGSVVSPVFGTLFGEDYDLFLGDQGKVTSNSHAVKVSDVGGEGQLQVDVGSTAGAGDVVVKIVVKAPKAKPLKLDARGATLGRPGAGGTLVGKTIGTGGGVVVVTDGSPIGKAGVQVPAGALASPRVISVASFPEQAPPSENDQAAGPAVDLRPSGTTFLLPVTVTLPFDLAKVPADADPGTDLRILVREDDGTEFEVEPDAVDEEAGTLTTSLTGFSVCIPIVKIGTPRLGVSPGGDEFWLLGLSANLSTDGGNDSRARNASLDFGEVSFFGDGTFQFSVDRRSFSLDNPPDGSGGVTSSLSASSEGDEFTSTWTYGADGRTIEVAAGEGDPVVLRLSRDGTVGVTTGDSGTDNYVELTVAARKATTAPTVASLSGAWHVGYFEISGRQDEGSFSPAGIRVGRAFGSFTFDGKGVVKLAAVQRRSAVSTGSGAVSNPLEKIAGSATYAVDGDGTVLVTIPDDEIPTVLRFLPCRDGGLMLGTDSVAQGAELLAFVLVRQASGLSNATLAGEFFGNGLDVDPTSYGAGATGGAPFVPDAGFRVEDLTGSATGGTITIHGVGFEMRRNPGQPGGIETFTETDDFSAGLSVASNGKFTISISGEGSVVGATSADGMFRFILSDPVEAGASCFLGFLLKPPPPKP